MWEIDQLCDPLREVVTPILSAQGLQNNYY